YELLVDGRLSLFAFQYHSLLRQALYCGHVHQHYKVKRLNEKSLIVNLSVEVWNYYPVTFEEISSAVSAFLKEEKKSKPVSI
ncbi:MAG: hypothetical protein KKB22_04980, partial [Candidatus Omnitrophica bacterium]|nr:hypothetical protein [Candidatus Omnitrophota bacterium]